MTCVLGREISSHNRSSWPTLPGASSPTDTRPENQSRSSRASRWTRTRWNPTGRQDHQPLTNTQAGEAHGKTRPIPHTAAAPASLRDALICPFRRPRGGRRCTPRPRAIVPIPLRRSTPPPGRAPLCRNSTNPVVEGGCSLRQGFGKPEGVTSAPSEGYAPRFEIVWKIAVIIR